MRLVQQHIIKSTDHRYKDLLDLCHLSKNLYNATLYDVRQHFFSTEEYKPYWSVDKTFKESSNPDYRALPAQTSQQVMRGVDSEFKSFFSLLKKKQSGKYDKPVQIPHYLKKDGYHVVTYTRQSLSHKNLIDGIIKIPRTDIQFKTPVTDIQQVRFVPRAGYIVMEVVYNKKEEDLKTDNGRYASIDLGINNLAAVSSNVAAPYLINGRPVKSLNQYYNKKKAHIQSQLGDSKKTSHRLQTLSLKRNNKINDYFHKSSSFIVNQLVSDSINTIIIGYNKGWKQDINKGKQTNQNFCYIPHLKFVSMLQYKCRLKGINVIMTEESYTSQSSFMDHDPLPSYGDSNIPVFSGKRPKRGLYVTGKRFKINADVNGSLNIMRKAVGDVTLPPDRGFVSNPVRISF